MAAQGGEGQAAVFVILCRLGRVAPHWLEAPRMLLPANRRGLSVQLADGHLPGAHVPFQSSGAFRRQRRRISPSPWAGGDQVWPEWMWWWRPGRRSR